MKMKSFECATAKILETVVNEFEKMHTCRATQTHVTEFNGKMVYTAFVWYEEKKGVPIQQPTISLVQSEINAKAEVDRIYKEKQDIPEL